MTLGVRWGIVARLVRLLVYAVASLLALVPLSGKVEGESRSSGWPVRGGDLHNTGSSSGIAGPLDSWSPAWTAHPGGDVRDLVGGNGQVIVATEDGAVYALSGASGDVLWRWGSGGTPVELALLDEGQNGERLLVLTHYGSGNSSLVQLDTRTRQIDWQSPAAGAPPLGVAGFTLVSRDSGGALVVFPESDSLPPDYSYGIRAIEARSGNTSWYTATGTSSSSGRAPFDPGNGLPVHLPFLVARLGMLYQVW